jgi:hypothetical protein
VCVRLQNELHAAAIMEIKLCCHSPPKKTVLSVRIEVRPDRCNTHACIIVRTSSILAACCVIGWYSGRSIAAKDVLDLCHTYRCRRRIWTEIFLVSAVVYSGTGIPFNFRISWTRSDLSRHQHSAADWNLLLCYHHHQLI